MSVKTPVRHRQAAAVTVGALTAAFAVATCSALPLALAIFGLGTATSLTMIGVWFEPHKGLITIIAGVGIVGGFFLACRPHKDQGSGADAGATPANTRAM